MASATPHRAVDRSHTEQGLGRFHLRKGGYGRVLANAVTGSPAAGPSRNDRLHRWVVRTQHRRDHRIQDRHVQRNDLQRKRRRPDHPPDGDGRPSARTTGDHLGGLPALPVGGIVGDQYVRRLDRGSTRSAGCAQSHLAAHLRPAALRDVPGDGGVHPAAGSSRADARRASTAGLLVRGRHRIWSTRSTTPLSVCW